MITSLFFCHYLNVHFPYYGFIIRYPEGKAHITQFMYEPWHLRYLEKKMQKK
ncbi:D-alanyl-D-alanine carboxypeptidase family protein [Staphylococcus xylosus]|uniref:D-alanyl-D-alanine carboxypeptidase family protein n=1 Tax=Staphylococcus xylosus TaxID=1288 RepID=UPI003F73B4A3